MKTENLTTNGLLVAAMIVSLYVVRCSDRPAYRENADGEALMQRPPDQDTDPNTSDVLADEGSDHATLDDRGAAVSDLRVIRAQIIAELEQVRDRLNQGTQPEPRHDADCARAAELAQGLERTDRALALAELASDEDWADAADTTREATNEVRAWWHAHREPVAAN